MRTPCTFGSLLVLAVAQFAFADQIILSPTDDAQLDRTDYQSPYTLTNPPPYGGFYLCRRLSTTGELHEGFLKYSLASLPSNATVTSASFTYGVNLVSSPNGTHPSFSISLYDGGNSQVTMADLSKDLVNVAQSQDLSLGTYTTDFFSVSALNNRNTSFPSGYVGVNLFPRIESYQARVSSVEQARQYGDQAPVVTITYTVPEPASIALLGAAGALALLYWRMKARR